MSTRRLLMFCFGGSLAASVASAEELPPIPKGQGLGVASVSMVIALTCDIHYKRPQVVSDAKALFLKFARKELKDPESATERAFSTARRGVTRQSTKQYTKASCDQLGRMLRRELAR
ncbi:hypothetical protein [Rhizobium leguminosarum]|uniref:Uncharacterized protein n=1 Tax=Rhizobium leguminosarum TaxID=384 RepID=A0A7K3VDK3_RHILE|nr:hypothetical protein [Rhizobium leguminosarum]MBY5327593.1 hypothetical protein [Rhizobium leguminosarum]NEK15220.1 hypothetical protein [Rhizobium leguminosarum]